VNCFIQKGFGRIFVRRQEDIDSVVNAIRAIDAFEADYLRNDLIAVLSPTGTPKLLYTHKFEIDIDALTLYCWQRGICIWCVSQRGEVFDVRMPSPPTELDVT
jgi:hypothetical protein